MHEPVSIQQNTKLSTDSEHFVKFFVKDEKDSNNEQSK